MKSSMEGKWLGDMAFEAEVNGHKVIMDATDAVGGHDRGPRPKELMVTSLLGCTGMDVVSILKKMHVEFDSLNLRIETELTEEHPKHYTSMHIIYSFRGNELPMDKLEKAIELSQDKYCGVSAVYKQVMPITHEIRINE
ncbi:MAG: OsmC family protein [Bacteroidales bacterium]|jgi:putative redox protein|nr:OsmC family protein [Bacteroidales bacterium]